MATNSKAYKVVFVDGDERVIEASSVVESNDRIGFFGAVDGYGNGYTNDNLIASFLAAGVSEYGVVPVLEEERIGASTYRITFINGAGVVGTPKEVVADKVLFSQGPVKGAGQFSLVTLLRDHTSRTEFVAGESIVYSVERVTDSTADVTLPSPAASADEISA